MSAKLFLILFMLVFLQNAYADNDITLNGTYGAKAILLIKGELLMLREGQSVKGVKLVKVYPEKADVIYKKKPLTLTLEQSLSDDSFGFAQNIKSDKSKTHILSAKLVEQYESSVVFDVEYFYDGRNGEYVTLTAKTLFKGKLTEYWAHTYTKLKEGRNRVKITINMNAKAPSMYYSDAVRFEMLWASETGSGKLYSKSMQFIKQWRKL